MTLPDVREVRDAWPPKRTLFLVPDEEGEWFAVVQWAPMPDRYGDHMLCTCPDGRQVQEDRIDGNADVDSGCPHELAVRRYRNKPATEPQRVAAVNPGLYE